MSTRTYAIPALAAVALSTSGCLALDPIMGDWEMVEFQGEDVEDYDIEGTVSFEVEDGEIVGEFEMEYNGYDLDGDVEAEKTDKGEYDIDIDGDNIDLKNECELDGDELECDDDGFETKFERD